MIRAVRRTAATAAIQYVLRSAGASATAERTRSFGAGPGAPLTSSKMLFSSRRNLSLGLTSEHLLHREVSPQPLCGAVDARLGGRGRNSQRPRHLVEREIEIEMQDEGQPLVRSESQEGAMQVGLAFDVAEFGLPHFRELDNRPPS